MQEVIKETIIPKFLQDVKQYDKMELEDALIKVYLGKSIGEIEQRIKAFFLKQEMELDLEVLVYIFEALIEKNIVSEKGVVFTPEYIAEFILKGIIDEEKGWNDNIKIIDPSCGCGIFLLTAILWINKKYGVSISKIIKNNIYGIDIDENNVRRCKKLIFALAEKYGESDNVKINDIHIICADSLKCVWNECFNVDKYDYIIGNPPYVNTHDMNEETAVFLKSTFSTTKRGVYNIFYAFVEYAMKFLKDDGRLSYIIPNNFLTIKSATDLREYLVKNNYIKQILDFGDNMVFKPIRTYNCIIVLDKTQNEQVRYSVMDKVEKISEALREAKYDVIPNSRLDKNGWKLVDYNTFCNIKKIENQFKPIKEFIRTGIATLKDEIFILDYDENGYYKKVGGIRYNIEPGVVKKLYKIPELKKSKNICEVSKHIIFPYVEGDSGYKIIEEKVLKEKYPCTFNYLYSMRKELDKRDKGKPNPIAWYAYGRTQGLNRYGSKLLFPTFAESPKFILVKDKNALFCNGYGIFENDYLELEQLLPILNSKVMKYYVSNTSYSIEGGYYCYQKKYIEKFSLPWFNDEEKKILQSGNMDLVDELLVKKYKLAI